MGLQVFFVEWARKTTKKRNIIPAEPLKSLRKTGKTLKKHKEFLSVTFLAGHGET